MLSPVALTSLLFKCAVYIYLRIIPATVAKFVLPALFLSYFVCFASDKHVATNRDLPPSVEEPNSVLCDQNGNLTEDVPHSIKGVTNHGPFSQLCSQAGLYRIVVTHYTPTLPLRLAAFLLNLLLFLFAMDFTLRPLYESNSGLVFTRIGAVEPNSVKIVVRYPNMSDSIRILYRPEPFATSFSSISTSGPETPWLNGPIVDLREENDWVGAVKLKRLSPGQNYQYRLGLVNATPLPILPISFRTFPDNRVASGSKFRFVASSCVMPNFPYTPLAGNRIRGFDLLASYIAKTKATSITGATNNTAKHQPSPLEFGLLLGDFIYADVPLRVARSSEAYTRLYRRNYASASYRKVYEQLPIFTIYDDHEIVNNFAGGVDRDTQDHYRTAIQPFAIYHGQANFDPIRKGEHYYEFKYGDVAFFVLDTRKHRNQNFTPEVTDNILGRSQVRALHSWLHRASLSATYKVIISSVPFTTLWRGDAEQDSWAGFESERSSILSALVSTPNTFVLSGDRHKFAAIQHLGSGSGKVIEISTSPLSMFWIPFPSWLKIRKRSKRMVLRESDVESGVESEWLPEESVIKHVAKGHYKWSVIEVDTTDPSNPRLSVELFVDGKLAWRNEFAGSPVNVKSSAAVGAQLSILWSSVFDRISTVNNPIAKFLSG